MKKFDKIDERTIEAVVGGAVVEIGPKAVVKCSDDIITLFFMNKEYSYPNDAFAVKKINGEIGKYFYDKDAYMLDLPTRYEVYDTLLEYEDAKKEMAMYFMDELLKTNGASFRVVEWDEKNGEAKIAVVFMDDEYIYISYDLDEDKFTMTDDYCNWGEVYYNVEDEDWYFFQNSFREVLADLVAETAKSAVNNNWL